MFHGEPLAPPALSDVPRGTDALALGEKPQPGRREVPGAAVRERPSDLGTEDGGGDIPFEWLWGRLNAEIRVAPRSLGARDTVG